MRRFHADDLPHREHSPLGTHFHRQGLGLAQQAFGLVGLLWGHMPVHRIDQQRGCHRPVLQCGKAGRIGLQQRECRDAQVQQVLHGDTVVEQDLSGLHLHPGHETQFQPLNPACRCCRRLGGIQVQPLFIYAVKFLGHGNRVAENALPMNFAALSGKPCKIPIAITPS